MKKTLKQSFSSHWTPSYTGKIKNGKKIFKIKLNQLWTVRKDDPELLTTIATA